MGYQKFRREILTPGVIDSYIDAIDELRLSLFSSEVVLSNRDAIGSYEIDNSYKMAATKSFSTLGDSGQAVYVRVNSEPVHNLKKRSLDRFDADGNIDQVNGGWWEALITKIDPRQCGAISGGIIDDTVAFEDMATYMNEKKFRRNCHQKTSYCGEK